MTASNPSNCLSQVGKPIEIDPRLSAALLEIERLRAALERIKGCSHEGRMLPMCYAIAVDALGSICFCGHCLDCLRRERGGVADEGKV